MRKVPTAPVSGVRVVAFRDAAARPSGRADRVAVEAPLEIRFGGLVSTVLMRTPGHDEDLVRGFMLSEGIVGALRDLGRDIDEVRWILLTHGHIDHLGGAHALWELTGRRAQVVIHEADAHLLRSRRAHVDLYASVRQQYLRDPDGVEKQSTMADEVISGEMAPSVLLKGGEALSLGGAVTVSVHNVPGHTAGSVAYVVEGQDAVFVGDAVQVHGAANGFPGSSRGTSRTSTPSSTTTGG